ncbi:MAG: methionine--tRNA ligase [Planctomycetes bacterium]|nr:methionine--tRNA ligase [Planctomycetota bacterium]
MGKVLVTAALPYANGRVHLGHLAGAYLPADTYVRWRRLKGDDVVFICGSDEHGVPITLSALKRKCSPQEVVDEFHKANGAAFAAAGVAFDIWGRTSSPEHHALSQDFFAKLLSKGYIDRREIQQYYSEKSKMFLPDRYVEGTCPHCGNERARGDECENCQKPYEVTDLKNPRSALPGDDSAPVLKATSHWFLRLDTFQPRLERYVAAHGEGQSEAWRNNTLRGAEGWLKLGLRARCITRDTEWGVKIPLSEPGIDGKRLYVWFDAPIGYVTFTQQLFAQRGNPEGWREYWQNPACPIYNFIGKDNIPFHAITWPAMEFGYNDAAADGNKYEIASQVVANEFLNFGADKFSKSRGNLIEIGWFVEKYGAESLRYYLTAVAPEENDSTFTWEDYARRYNGELADVLGNFVHRTLTFTHKYFDAKIPEGGPAGDGEGKLRAEISAALSESAKHLDGLRFKAGLARLMDLARAGNRFFDEKAPWAQRKTDLHACGATIRVCCETTAALALGLRPFLPGSAPKILKSFGLAAEDAFKPGSAGLDPRSITQPGTPLAPPEVPFKKLEEKDLPAAQ